MKVNFKQLSKKTISCILALAVILCSVTVMFSAFATEEPAEAAEPYTVSYRSPAVPMFVGKAVGLKDLEIDFSEADGDTYAGDKVIWSAPDGDSAKIMGSCIYAAGEGITKFTVTYGETLSQNVYVIVNDEADGYEFAITDLDLTKTGEGGYEEGKWLQANQRKFGGNDLLIFDEETTVISQDTNGIRGDTTVEDVHSSWTDNIIVYNDAYLKDFADYTYEAVIWHNVSTSVYSPITATLITRVNNNSNAGEELFVGGRTEGAALGVQFALYGGPTIFNSANPYDYFTGDKNYYWGSTQLSTLPLANFQYNTTETSYALSQNSDKVYSVKVDGDDLVVKVDGTTVLDSDADTVYTSTWMAGTRQSGPNVSDECKPVAGENVTGADVNAAVAATTLGAGTIGFETTYTSNIRLKSVKVLLNNITENTMPNLKDFSDFFYTVTEGSPAIPMFAGKVVALSDIVVEFGDELVSGTEVEWTQPENSVVLKIGDVLYAKATGTAKFTAKYGETTKSIYMMVNEKTGAETDYDFYLVNEDYSETTTDQLKSDWMYAVSHNGGYWPNRHAASTQKYYRLDNTRIQYDSSQKAMKMLVTYSRGGMFLYNAPILSDFADYTLITDVNNYSYDADQYGSIGIAVRVNANFDATVATSSLSDGTAVDSLASGSNIFTLANGSLGSGMYLQHRQYGAVLLGNYNNNNGTNDTTNSFGKIENGSESLPLHSLTGDNWTKTLGYVASSKNAASDLNGDGTKEVVRPNINYAPTADPDYVLNPYAGDGDWIKGTAANAVKHTVEVQLSGKDIVYSINGKEILNTQKQMYQVSSSNGLATAESKTFYAEKDETTGEYLASETVTTNVVTNTEYSRDTYLEKFETAGVASAGNAIGFTNFQSGLYIYNLKVKLNGINKDTMPTMSDPAFYTVTSDNPVIPMTAATKLDTAGFLVEFGGNTVSGSALTWTTDADEAKLEIVDGVIYAYERGAYTATVTDGTTTDYVHIVVKNPDETEYVIYENDYRASTETVSDWKTTVMVDGAAYEYDLTDDNGNHINYVKTTDFPNVAYNPNGFAPFNYLALGTAVNATATITTYTTLDNDILADLTDYKVTAGMKMYGNHRGAVGIAGRVSNTVEGKYDVASSTAVGFGSFTGLYRLNGNYAPKGAFSFSGGSSLATSGPYTAVANTTVKDYLYSTVTGRDFYHRIFEITYSDDTATFTAPNGATEQITGLEATKGTVALWSESRDETGSTYRSVPVLTDIRVVLTNVDTSALELEAIDHTPAATPVIEKSYVDSENYTFGYSTSLKAITHMTHMTDGGLPSQKVVFPATLGDGSVVNALGTNIFFSNAASGTSDTTVQEMIAEAVISEGITSTYDNTFWQAQYLDSVTFPQSFATVGGSSFRGTGLIDVSFPEGSKLTTIYSYGFANNMSLVKMALPEGLKTIGAYAFYNDKVLYDVNIPSTVKTIDKWAFFNVPMTEVTIPASVEYIGERAFSGGVSTVSGVKYWKNETTIGTKTVDIPNNTWLKKVVILNPECEIADTAFYDNAATPVYHEADDPSTEEDDTKVAVTTSSETPVVVIYGYTGSTADTYAEEHGLEFVPIDNIQKGEIAANSAFNLAASSFEVDGTTVAGSDITWDAHRGADYEISNGWLLVYGEEDFTVTGTYKTAGDVSIAIKVAAKGTDTGLLVNTIADENMTVAPVADDATAYTVTINETDSVALEYGTLTVTADYCDAVKVTKATDSTGKVFGFNAVKPETMALEAEYTTLAERETSIYPLGVQVRPKTDIYTAGIRFVTRFPEITEGVGGIYLDEEYTQVGVLIIPNVLWTSGTLPEAAALSEMEVSMGNYNAQNIIIEKLMSANEAYADAAALLTNIPSGMYGVDIIAIPYLIGKDNSVTYVEGDMSIKSYNDVYNASYPTYNNNIDNLIYGGTDHDIDGIASTTSLSYGLNEDITFVIKLKGDYTMKWQLDKDDPDVNVIDGETYTEGSTVVKSGTFDPATDGYVFTLTTKMQQAGIARLRFQLFDAAGKQVINNDGSAMTFDMSAAAAYESITQSLEEGDYSAEDGYVEGMSASDFLVAEATDYYEEWTAAWDTQVAAVNKAIADDTGLAAWIDDTTKESGALYTVGDVLRLQVATKGSDYTVYSFWIATDSSVGLGSSDVINNRPATGVFSVPNGAADASLGMLVSYCAYGGESVGTGAPTKENNVYTKIDVRILNHGKDNGSEFDVTSNGMVGTDPSAVYQYGILRRDYIAMQVAKALFSEYNGNIKTSGGSMGGWQAVACAALDSDVNEIDTFITWMCQIGAVTYGDIDSWNPNYTTEKTASRVFSTVTAARIINNRVKDSGEAFTISIDPAGLGDYNASAPHGVIALYNAFTAENVTKSANFYQFKQHGAQVYGTYTEFVSALSNK